ncbi:TPA: fimbrial protein [Escherichia coli]|nr:fimbrial protein [Escherichia coli]HBA8202371.1 fimbrial protein [Escherichia coli]HBA9372930.1 fimbrial protein [Escherichia coli]
MNMQTILIIMALFISPWNISYVFADTIFNKNINLGSHSITPQDIVNSKVPFYIQTEQIKSECIGPCKQVRISWTPLAPVLNIAEPSQGFMFSSGVAGIAVLLKQNPYNTIEQQLEVSLLKISNSTDSGELKSMPLLRRTVEQIGEHGNVINRLSEDISVSGTVNRSGCIIPQGQSLNMTLSPVSTSLLKNAVQGETLTSISADTFLSIRCEPNAVGALDLLFSAYDRLSTQPMILPALTESGKQSGVGFIVKAQSKNISWDGKSILNIPFVTDGTSITIPFRAYYTKISDDINPGNVIARGMMTVKYH